jgi:hypothetical protein
MKLAIVLILVQNSYPRIYMPTHERGKKMKKNVLITISFIALILVFSVLPSFSSPPCNFTSGSLTLDGSGIDFDLDGNIDLRYVSTDFMGNPYPSGILATEGGSYCEGGVGSGNRISNLKIFGISDFCSVATAVNFVPGSENIGTYFTYTGGGAGDLFAVRTFNGNKYFKILIEGVISNTINFFWTEISPPACETCVPGQPGMGICPQPYLGGIITGQVTNSDGAGIGKVFIQAHDLENNEIGGTQAEDNGYFSIKVPEGTYKLYCDPWLVNEDYLPGWYDLKDDFSAANNVQVTANGQIPSDIQFILMRGERITGRVTDVSGYGIQGVHVTAYKLNGEWVNHTPTDSSGNYVLGVPAGTYTIFFDPRPLGTEYIPEWYRDGDPVSVNPGVPRTEISAQLEIGYRITGWVTDGGGNGIREIRVSAYDLSHKWINDTQTKNDGNFILRVPEGTYKIFFDPGPMGGDYSLEWFNNKRTFEGAVPIQVNPGPPTTGIDAQLETAGRITGRVTDGGGNGIGGVHVTAYDLSHGWINNTQTMSNGDFILRVPEGTYKIFFDPGPMGGDYLSEWFNNRRSFEEADPVQVAPGVPTTGINAQLEMAYRITGRVTGASEIGLANVSVSARDLANTKWVSSAVTNADGFYDLILPEGSYKINFNPHPDAGNYAQDWINGKSAFNVADIVDTRSIQPGQTFNARLKPVQRVNSSDVGVYNGQLSCSFSLIPGFTSLLQSVTLTGPSRNLPYNYDLILDKKSWYAECRNTPYIWTHVIANNPQDFGPGEYEFTFQFVDGWTETYSKNLQPTVVYSVDPKDFSVQFRSDGSAEVSWAVLPGNAGRYYQVRVRDNSGSGEYFSSSQTTPAYPDQNSMLIPASNLKCLEKGQNYKWLLRVFDVDGSLYNYGVNYYNSVAQTTKNVIYDYVTPSPLGNSVSNFQITRWGDKYVANFDVRPGSRDKVVEASIYKPGDEPFAKFDLNHDIIDKSSSLVFYKEWRKEFDSLNQFDVYTLKVVFLDNQGGEYEETKEDLIIDVTNVVPVDQATMTEDVKPNGAIWLDWDTPQGGQGQRYQVKIRSMDDEKEFYSAQNITQTLANVGFSNLRGLEHCKTYRWLVLTYDTGGNNIQQTESLDTSNILYNPFNIPCTSLTVSTSGDGTGKVISSPHGINCGTYCSDTFVKDIEVALIAAPDPGSIFAGWVGSCSGTGSCTVTMDTPKTVSGIFIRNTPMGSQVVVQPVDQATSTRPVTVTIDSVTAAGETFLTISHEGASPPEGFKLGDPPTYYDITTTAFFTPPVKVCINYSGITFGNESNLGLFHFEGSAWVDRTVSLDTTNKITCASVTSLSPFAIFEATTHTVTASVAGNSAGGSVLPPSQTVTHGRTAIFTVSTNTGFTATVSEGSLAGNTWTIPNITSSHTVTVTFTQFSVTPGSGKYWIGLKNSDDQGTQFDLKTELLINGSLVSEGKALCITGVTRNPPNAKEVTVPFGSVTNGSFKSGNILSLKVSTRIGTTPEGLKCAGPGGSHNNAVGLRLYYDGPTRGSEFAAQIDPGPIKTYYLHTSGSNNFLDNLIPTGSDKYKDSAGINFNNGNPWKEIGTWSMTLP